MTMDLIVETECRHFVIDAFACCYKKAQCKYSVIWRNRRIFISLSFFLSPLNPVLKAFCCFRFLIAFSSFAIRANFYSWQFGLCQLTFRTNVQETRTSDKHKKQQLLYFNLLENSTGTKCTEAMWPKREQPKNSNGNVENSQSPNQFQIENAEHSTCKSSKSMKSFNAHWKWEVERERESKGTQIERWCCW